MAFPIMRVTISTHNYRDNETVPDISRNGLRKYCNKNAYFVLQELEFQISLYLHMLASI